MNLCLFFEGTGQGVAGRYTNVTRLRDLCVENDSQKLHLEAGAGTRFGAYLAGSVAGLDWRASFRDSRRWFEKNYRSLPDDADATAVYLFGFSRGALFARHFAAWLDKLGLPVAYLGLWDTVDATAGLDVSQECPANVRAARHAVARDETRRFFGYVPLRDSSNRRRVAEILFPGSHSDVGGLYDDNHVVADVALAWVAAGAKTAGLRLRRGADIRQRAQKPPMLHDSHSLASNLWGAFDRVKRDVSSLKLHRLFRKLKSLPSV